MKCWRALYGLLPYQLLCAGCGNGEGHVAPVYAKRSLAQLLTVKLNGFGTFCLKTLSGAFGASGWPVGGSWVPPGCLLGASWVPPGCLLGASWVPPGCLLGVWWVLPDESRCFLMAPDACRCFQMYIYIYISIHDLFRVSHGICQEKLCSETLFTITCLLCHSLF